LIPKPGGGERPLGIPTIRDRVVQTAALLIVQSIFEADMEPTAHGYRPGRGAPEAVQEVHRALCAGHTAEVDADVSQCFDTIPHAAQMRLLARRLSDRRMPRLLKLWVKAPVAEPAAGGGWRLSEGKRATRGTPQGGVISPLLANLYMNRYLKVFRLRGLDGQYGARSSSSPSSRLVTNRARHLPTVLPFTRSCWATAVFVCPLAALSSMRARCASACALVGRRAHRSSVLRSSSARRNSGSGRPGRRRAIGAPPLYRENAPLRNIVPMTSETRH
jgi:hypothetical protein